MLQGTFFLYISTIFSHKKLETMKNLHIAKLGILGLAFFVFTAFSASGQSATITSDQSVVVTGDYTVTTFTVEGGWGYLIKNNGVNVFISHDRGLGIVNAPDYNTQEEAMLAGELKINELKGLPSSGNSETTKNDTK